MINRPCSPYNCALPVTLRPFNIFRISLLTLTGHKAVICNRELLFIGKRKDEDDMAKSTKTYEERIRALEKKEQHVTFDRIEFPEPCISMAISAKIWHTILVSSVDIIPIRIVVHPCGALSCRCFSDKINISSRLHIRRSTWYNPLACRYIMASV